MMKNKKVFKTKKYVSLKTIDTIVLLSLLFIFVNNILINASIIMEKYTIDKSMYGWCLLIIMISVVSIGKILPFLIVYLGIRYAVKKYNKSVVTFDAESDIEYYRDKFKDINPATMSLLMNLNLELDKDLGAMKLYYELNDIYMYMSGSEIGINNPNKIKINTSDEILLKYFAENEKDISLLTEWKNQVIIENIQNNLIILKGKNEKKKFGCLLYIFLHILSFGYLVWFFINLISNIDLLNSIIIDVHTDEELLNLIFTNPVLGRFFILLVMVPIAIGVYSWSIWGGFAYSIIKGIILKKDKYKRTKDGNILAEKLYGMKNFIHDFSNLDEVSREQLVLWDDFLIYAVVLEENDIILKEISNRYDKDLLKYKHYNN